MNIQTSVNIGDKVFAMNNNKIIYGIVSNVYIDIDKNKTEEKCMIDASEFNGKTKFEMVYIYALTREELISKL